jgi:copper oxidase (laccase) domain-containing protein
VALADESGVIAVVHAGWRGVLDGVLQVAVDAMGSLGAHAPVAILGPCIHPEHYAFGEPDLALVAARYGPGVRSRTAGGVAALDLPACVGAALAEVGVDIVARVGGCTAAEAERRWSHRARSDVERQAMVAWLDLGPTHS